MKTYYDDDFTGLYGELMDDQTSPERQNELFGETDQALRQVLDRHPEWKGKKPGEIYNLLTA